MFSLIQRSSVSFTASEFLLDMKTQSKKKKKIHSGGFSESAERISAVIKTDDARVLIPKITFTDKSLF